MSSYVNVEAGACSITVGETGVGHTIGRTVVRFQPIWRPRREDQYGAAIVDKIYLGSEATVTACVAEKTLANLKLAVPHGLDGSTWLGVGRTPGFKLSSAAQQVTLHPLDQSGAGKDIILHKAAAHGPIELPYEEGEERSFLVQFVGLVDSTQTDGELLGRINAGA